MNLPFDRIHDPLNSFGYLIFPIFWKKNIRLEIRWVAYFDKYKFALTDTLGFHNCRKTGIY
jgi:hypothetical protein